MNYVQRIYWLRTQRALVLPARVDGVSDIPAMSYHLVAGHVGRRPRHGQVLGLHPAQTIHITTINNTGLFFNNANLLRSKTQ